MEAFYFMPHAFLLNYPLLLQGSVVPWGPSLLMGVFAMVAALSTLRHPETLGATMPDTIHEMETNWKPAETR